MSKVDLAKRRRIMQRSMKLGHCICDPRRQCPCDIFKEQSICPCAGERPDRTDISQVKLTEMVHNGGCASKIPAADLEMLLSRLPAVDDPSIVSGLAAGDDAGVYNLTDGVTLVQTVDVFTPCVDDPFMFGRICAANCLSDAYAMGAVPRTALSVLAFPSETLDGQIMYLMLKGAMETLAEANCSLLGGHSIKDDEIKLGFAITATIDAGKAVALETARVGDVLVLTKPLGVGVLGFARQIGRSCEAGMAAAEVSMATLNRSAADAMNEVGVSACTDVTGFGLFGHLIRMARHSGVTAEVHADALPAFEGAVEALREGIVPGAIERNREFVADDLLVDEGVDQALVDLGFDAQTSGGLMIAVPQERSEQLLTALADRGVTAVTIGRISDNSDGKIVMTSRDDCDLPIPSDSDESEPDSSCESQQDTHGPECCAEFFGDSATASQEAAGQDTKRAFASFLRTAGAAGALDERTKELITFSLVVMSRCGPCVKAHLAAAAKMGITRSQLDEAAWLAVAMGGAPVRLFYQEATRDMPDNGGNCCC